MYLDVRRVGLHVKGGLLQTVCKDDVDALKMSGKLEEEKKRQEKRHEAASERDRECTNKTTTQTNDATCIHTYQ